MKEAEFCLDILDKADQKITVYERNVSAGKERSGDEEF